MKSYRFDGFGSLDCLKLNEEADPAPSAGEVLIQMRAAALNFRDIMVMRNMYPIPLRTGLVPLSDGAGEVVAVGAGVTRFKPGDGVIANFQQRWIGGRLKAEYLGSDLGGSKDGVLSEYVVLPEEGVLPKPEYMSFVEAGALACAGITAWASLAGGPPLQPGQTVLVQGTGGVSLFALQLAKAFGARVIATTSSAAKADRLKSLGADEIIDYVEMPAWSERALALTGGRGVNRIVEVAGPSTIDQSIKSLAIGGHLAFVGFMAGVEGAFNPLAMLGRGLTMEAIAVGSRADFEAMLQTMTAHSIHPVIHETFAFEDAHRAYQTLEGRGHIGKVAIEV